MRSSKPYNGLQIPAGGVPQFGAGSEQERMKRAIAMEMQAMARDIYVAAVAGCLADDSWEDTDALRALARKSQLAARQFFIGLGVIEEEPEPE